jgi:hypothetical protein
MSTGMLPMVWPAFTWEISPAPWQVFDADSNVVDESHDEDDILRTTWTAVDCTVFQARRRISRRALDAMAQWRQDVSLAMWAALALHEDHGL